MSKTFWTSEALLRQCHYCQVDLSVADVGKNLYPEAPIVPVFLFREPSGYHDLPICEEHLLRALKLVRSLR